MIYSSLWKGFYRLKSFWKHLFLDNGDISLVEAGLQKFVPQQINNYKVKHDIVFHIILDGKGIYSVNNEVYHLQAQDGFILKKNRRVFYIPDEDEPWTICWIGLGGENLMTYLNNTLIMSKDILNFEEESRVFDKMQDFIRFLEKSMPDDTLEYLQIFQQLYELLSLMNQELAINHSLNNAYSLMEPNLADKIYVYIYENFLKDITVTGIAEHFDISRNYLFKLCKDYFGQSPKQMILELRMNQASQLLRGSKMHVKEIANIVGYKDPFTFSKMFKEYYHHSPSHFRQLSEDEIDEALFIREKFLKRQMLGGEWVHNIQKSEFWCLYRHQNSDFLIYQNFRL